MSSMISRHIPVLLTEVLNLLKPEPNQNYLDGTVGDGGHASAILERTGPEGKLLGIDLDQDAVVRAQMRLAEYGGRTLIVQGNYRDLGKIMRTVNFGKINGILLDLGISSWQLSSQRGFSFNAAQRLDMRFDPNGSVDAHQIVNFWSLDSLIGIFKEYGEERFSQKIAQKICQARTQTQINTTKELAELIGRTIPRKFWPKKIHPATKVFQALRIAVNNELENIRIVLPEAVKMLEPGGRLAIISFHSLEDRLVKEYFKKASINCICPAELPKCQCQHLATVKLLTKKPVTAGFEEIKDNPRSRSAKLRVIEKL